MGGQNEAAIGLLGWRQRWKVFIGGAALALAIGACGGTPPQTAKTPAPGSAPSSGAGSHSSHSGASTGSAGSLPVCQTAKLTIAIGPTGANAGMSGGDLEFTNTGSAACQLIGWPELVGVTARGSPSTAVKVKSTLFGPFNGGVVSAVRIDAGATAAAAFIVGANNCSDSYRTLRVTPPGNTQSVVVSAWLPNVKTYLPACAPINVSPLVVASQLPNPAPQA